MITNDLQQLIKPLCGPAILLLTTAKRTVMALIQEQVPELKMSGVTRAKALASMENDKIDINLNSDNGYTPEYALRFNFPDEDVTYLGYNIASISVQVGPPDRLDNAEVNPGEVEHASTSQVTVRLRVVKPYYYHNYESVGELRGLIRKVSTSNTETLIMYGRTPAEAFAKVAGAIKELGDVDAKTTRLQQKADAYNEKKEPELMKRLLAKKMREHRAKMKG